MKDYEINKIGLVKQDKLHFINYNGKVSPKIQLPIVEIKDDYIIPSANNKYYKSDYDRYFIKMLIDNQEIIDFFTTFGDKIKSLVSKPNNQFYNILTERDESYYFKMKLQVRDECIETKLYIDDEYTDFDIDDLRHYLRKGAHIRLVIYPAKIWFMPANKQYGVQFKVNAIKITQEAPQIHEINNTPFVESDDD